MRTKIILLFSLLLVTMASNAQDKLYENTFPLGDVKLLDGPFKHACSLNTKVLLEYETDRLLAPYLKEAGLPLKAEVFENWAGLDGHVGGHYLSALAIHYAATGDEACKERMDYMISELKRCQVQNGDGYVGGVPDGKKIWDEVKNGNVGIIWKAWVPWYNIHKTYAGLRDAWLYGGSQEARKMFLDLCDWGLSVIAPLSDEQMEQMLGNEFGGMDEVYADAYQMTSDKKYLDAAKRFSHKWLYDSMLAHNDNLDNKHANTQVPKVVGYARIAEVDNNKDYADAADYFWNRVVNYRSLSLGGNSRREHFAPAEDCKSYVEDREGPESCNTNNMLKLTEDLFCISPSAKYADFYERALYNHILSTQHPEHGGYVYFTPARPAHYRVYSSPNSAMWCCVGTGMENHGKYGEFIYTHAQDSLYVNLFIASELTWKEKKVTITQQTNFPDEEGSKLIINTKRPVQFKLLIRHPGWATDGMKVVCQGEDYAVASSPSSYIVIDRKWKDGDVVEISMPMSVRIEELPNVSNYISILRGPILLGAKMGQENLNGLVADDSRWGHIASGPLVSVFDTPLLIGDRDEILAKLKNMQPVSGKPFSYTVPNLFKEEKYKDLVLEPFFRIHDSRYMMYWLSMTESEYMAYQKRTKAEEENNLFLDKITIDAVGTGEQQPEVDHKMKNEKSATGYYEGESFRNAKNGGFFSYEMETRGQKDLFLMVRYWGNETEKCSFDILIDGKLLTAVTTSNRWRRKEFVNETYAIPSSMIEGKQTITVAFRSKSETTTGGIYKVRLLNSSSVFINPVLWADVPDPDVIRVGEYFYLVSTTMHLMPGAPVMRSKDLVNWEIVSYLFDKISETPNYDMVDGTVYGRGQWATSIRYHKGKFYAYFSPNDNPFKGFVYTTTDPAKGWTLSSRLPHFHDASLFFDDDDKAYIFYGTGQLRELNEDLSGVKEGGVDMHVFQRDAEETGLLEGSRVIKHDGKYYLLMISWPGQINRRQVCYRADKITGPYEKKVILNDALNGFPYAGQGTIVDDANGNWYGVIFQDRGGVGRVLTLMPCRWEDGWPILGDANGHIPQLMEKPVQGAANVDLVVSDDFSDKKMKLNWQWNHNPVNEAWSLTERRGYLRLKTNRVVDNVFAATNTLTQRMEGPICSAVVSFDVSKMIDGDVAGFSAFNGDAGVLSVIKEGEKKYINMTSCSVSLDNKSKAIKDVKTEDFGKFELTGDVVYLRIDADFNLNKDIATFYYSLDNENWTPIGTEYKMIFDYRRLFMGSKFAIFNYATKKTGGYVDVDFFEYSKNEIIDIQ